MKISKIKRLQHLNTGYDFDLKPPCNLAAMQHNIALNASMTSYEVLAVCY